MSHPNQFVPFSRQLHIAVGRLGRGFVKAIQHIHRAELAGPARLTDEADQKIL
jgi:hypothetical protein